MNTVTYSHTVKINLGNYESHDVFVSQTQIVDELFSLDELRERVRLLAKEEVNEIYRKKKGKPLSDREMSLRYGL